MESESPNSLGAQWRRAALELDIECRVPFTLSTPTGESFEFACLLPQFGGERGILLLSSYNASATGAATAAGFGYACVEAARPSEPFELSTYIECLIDWGWLASGSPAPDWYVAGVRNAV